MSINVTRRNLLLISVRAFKGPRLEIAIKSTVHQKLRSLYFLSFARGFAVKL